ncbi:PREDICTED: sialin-like [Priapulus caudatus]|uniref:Sialin-like n=1 Tax=Priapulus caudatus TaxID=37621 RepID=A0ABM1FC51_PRICU|nr:PREDICTED: sialin-like [Priapulus caudatus]
MNKDTRIEEMESAAILKAPFLFSSRFALALAAFFGFVVLYIQRFNMSVAIVCMVNNTAVRAEAGIDADGDLEGETGDRCLATVTLSNDTTDDETGEFVWSKPTQGIVLSAFFWGYLLTQLPGGWLATYLGGKRVYGYGQLLASVMALLAPVASNYSYKTLLVVRFIQGIGQGVVFPAMHVFWGTWAHPYERSKLVNFTIAVETTRHP